jgi:hypothetical protein
MAMDAADLNIKPAPVFTIYLYTKNVKPTKKRDHRNSPSFGYMADRVNTREDSRLKAGLKHHVAPTRSSL